MNRLFIFTFVWFANQAFANALEESQKTLIQHGYYAAASADVDIQLGMDSNNHAYQLGLGWQLVRLSIVSLNLGWHAHIGSQPQDLLHGPKVQLLFVGDFSLYGGFYYSRASGLIERDQDHLIVDSARETIEVSSQTVGLKLVYRLKRHIGVMLQLGSNSQEADDQSFKAEWENHQAYMNGSFVGVGMSFSHL